MRIAKAEAIGRRYFVIVILRDRVLNVDLDTTRPYKIRLSNSNKEDID